MAHVEIFNEVGSKWTVSGGWRLCFQWCEYQYDDGTSQKGYRFIWRRPNGHLQAGRAQCRLPSIAIAMELVEEARRQGWADNVAVDKFD